MHQQESSPKVIFLRLMCSYQQETSPKVVESSKYFGAQITFFLPNLKIGFIVIVTGILCLTHYNRCSYTRNMIMRSPMGTIHSPLNSGSRVTETTAFIQWINGQETQIRKLWCLGLDGIFRKVHPTANVKVLAGTVGKFVTNYLA